MLAPSLLSALLNDFQNLDIKKTTVKSKTTLSCLRLMVISSVVISTTILQLYRAGTIESRKVRAMWSRKLKRSGYPATVRYEVIRTACEKWEKMYDAEDSEGRPIFRPRGWKREE